MAVGSVGATGATGATGAVEAVGAAAPHGGRYPRSRRRFLSHEHRRGAPSPLSPPVPRMGTTTFHSQRRCIHTAMYLLLIYNVRTRSNEPVNQTMNQGMNQGGGANPNHASFQ